MIKNVCDTVQGFGDVDGLGNPYGFTPTPLQQHTPSFPVLVTSQMSRPRSVQQLILLSDGHYLSSSTASLSLRLVTYNSDAHALTYSKARFEWQEAGVITAAPPFILSLPVLAYASYSPSRFVLQQGQSPQLYSAEPLFGGGWDAFGLSRASLLNHALAWLQRLTA